MSDARTCPFCGSNNTGYQAFSGGREMWCYACETNYLIPEGADNKPRATLLQTEEGIIELRAQMDRELARRAAAMDDLVPDKGDDDE